MAQSPQLKQSSPTSPDPQDFRLDATPAMRADNVVSGEHWRIGLITDSLVRFEWSDSGVFENRPTQTVLNRDFGSPVERRVTERDGRVIIDTAALTIVYDQQPFSKEGLSVVVKGVADTQFNTWHYGDAQRGNLKGTARTLDEADGAIELDNGVISRDGWAVIDDSAANIIIETDTVNGKANPFGTWVSPRATAETDLYFFGYGHRYIEAVRDFYRLTGPTPLLPRFAMGNWWSRYYRYTQDGYLALMDRFKREGIPFTTSVIDMDWHRVDDVDPKYGSGWTGYSWNRELFPDPPAFLADLHRRGLRTTLNVHPRDGVRAFEDAYPEVAKRVGIDPATEENVEFDLTNPDFVDAYFDMHHRMEAEGVDFWWLDWQQGGVTRQKGLDPLWMLNHMHYLDSGRGGNWPLTFSRYAGPGSHRYPVGFSGDTIVTWESLAFQPQFTATASNIGYGWWSHDIGGHMFGYRNEELEARWYQLGAFSPINRLHSSNSPFSGKEPWNFNRDVSAAMVDALRLRHAMMPYLYTMNYRAAEAGRLKKELASLRKVMIGYINQIDSLNRLTAQQKEIIADVTKKYNAASRQISNLSEEKKNLTKTVTLAAQLDATNISVQPTNKRGKTAKKVKDIVKFKINFSIVKNITAETGERTLYIRITKPDNDVLTKSSSNTFPYENRELVYSIKKYIEYNGEEQAVTVYWDVEEYLYAGTYRVDIFADGTLIGSQSFSLN